MADFNTLLAQYANALGVSQSGPSLAEQKSATVSGVAAAKQSSLSGTPTPSDLYRIGAANATGKGIESSTGLERDLETLSTEQVFDKYGPELGSQLISQRASGQVAYRNDAASQRFGLEGAWDAGVGAVGAVGSTFGSIGALGLGVTDKLGLTPGAATVATGLMDDLSRGVTTTQTDSLNASKTVRAVKQALDERDHAQQRDVSVKAGDNALVANLAKIGKDTVSGVQNTDNADVIGDLSANAAGSLLAMGPLSKVVGVGAKALAARVAVGAAGPSRAAALIAKSTMPVSIGLMEGGGAYQQAASEVMNRGGTPEQANDAGLITAAIHGPAAAAITGVLGLNAFERTPFKIPHTAGELLDPLKEGLDEGLQGASQQLAQNLALKTTVDPNQDLTAQVGDQVAQGAIGGLASAGVLQAPGVATNAAVKTAVGGIQAVKAAGAAVVGGLLAKAEQHAADKAAAAETDATQAQVDAASGAYDLGAELKKMTENQAASFAAAGIDPAELQAKQAETEAQHRDIDTLMGLVQFHPSETVNEPEVVQGVTHDATDKFDAMRKAAAAIAAEHTTPAQKVQLGSWLQRSWNDEQAQSIAQLHKVVQGDREIPDQTPEELATLEKLTKFVGTFEALKDHPALQRGAEQAHTAAQDLEGIQAGLEDPNQAQHTAEAVVHLATTAPEKVSAEVADLVRQHAKSGGITLTPQQLAVLDSAQALVQAHQALNTGEQVVTDRVSGEVTNLGGKLGLGAAEHVRGITEAVQAGKPDLAEGLMANFGLFAHNQQRKVEALNLSGQSGKPESYSMLRSSYDREMGEDVRGAGRQTLYLHEEGSIKYAQRVAREAQAMAELHNQLVDAHPEIANQSKIVPVKLAIDPELNQKAADLVVTKAQPVEKPASVPVEPVQKAEPVLVEAPVKVEQPAETSAKPTEKAAEPVQKPAEKVVEQPAPEPAVVEEPPVVEAKTNPVEDVVPESAKTVKTAYPQLTGADKGFNWFQKAYRFSKDGSGSRITGLLEAPLDWALSAFDSASDFIMAAQRKVEAKLNDDLLGEYYEFVKDASTALEDKLNQRLQAFLGKESSAFGSIEGNLDNAEQMLNPVTNWLQGRVINLVEPIEGGGYRYNEQLLHGAILAALQWMVSTGSRPQQAFDEERVGKILGVAPTELPEGALAFFNNGMWKDEAVRSLAGVIERFWGVQTVDSAPLGLSQGIAEAMAGEIFDALVQNDDEKARLHEEGVGLMTKAKAKFNGKDYIQLALRQWEDGGENLQKTLQKLAAFPDALETLVVKEPVKTRYVGVPPDKVASTQQRNALVKHSAEQKDIIERNQRTEHRIDLHMTSFVEVLGPNMTQALFGPGSLENRKLNKNHAVSLKGQNISVSGAYQEAMAVLAELRNKAAAAGVKATELPIFYAYNFAKNGRLMMLGAYSPQASKLMRELVLPTHRTLDLANAEHQRALDLAMAQALGVKLNKKNLVGNTLTKAVKSDLQERLSRLAPAIDLLGKFLKTQSFNTQDVAALKAAFVQADIELTPVAVHALMDQARLKTLKPNAPFETSLYVEADGVTDGPFNALWHLATGRFSADWIDLVAKGGAYFGSAKTSLGDFIASATSSNPGPAKDLYEHSSDVVIGSLRHNLLTFKQQLPNSHAQLVKVLTVLDQTLGKDLNFDAKTGVLTLDRGVAKNPLTVTVYGSEAGGIANKITGVVVAALYEQISAVLEGQGDPADLARLQGLIEQLSSTKLVTYADGDKSFVTDKGIDRQPLIQPEDAAKLQAPLENYTLTPAHLQLLQDNLEELFVKPLQQGVNQTMGETAHSRRLLQKAIQLQSVWLAQKFRQRVGEKLDEKKKADRNFSNETFLSQAELDAIEAELRPFAPLVKLSGLELYMADTDASDVAHLGQKRAFTGFGASTTGGMQASPQINGPADAGVRGIPYTVIGFGDALMIKLFYQLEDAPQGTLPVFDGIHLALDKLFSDAVKVNQAVHQGLMLSPLGAVNETFQSFLQRSNLAQEFADGTLEPGMHEALRKVLERGEDGSTAQTILGTLSEELNQAALSAQARHNVLSQVQLSIDHMASTSEPYQHLQGLDLQGLSSAEKEARLNELYDAELAKLQDKSPTTTEATTFPPPAGTSEVPLQVVSHAGLKKLVQGLKLPIEQRHIALEAIRSMSQDWSVITGTLAQTLAHAQADGLSSEALAALRTGQGVTDPGSHRIYINSDVTQDAQETLVHELIHAALTEKLMAYGENSSAQSPEIRDSLNAIHTLMQQWLTLKPTSEAHETALRQIQGELSKPRLSKINKIAAMDEFIAWVLSNRELIKGAQTTKGENPVARVIKRVLGYVWRLIRARGDVVPARSDLFTALRFHTSVVMNGPAPLQTQAMDQVRMHSSAWGTSDRLTNVELAWNQKVAVHLDEQVTPLEKLTQDLLVTTEQIRIGDQVAESFGQHGWPMTPQEHHVFRLITASFAVLNKLDPVALSQAQTLFDHVMKTLQQQPDRLYDPAISDPQAQHYDADQKLNSLLGTYLTVNDLKGRSSLLPAFMALSAVSEPFRAMLKTLPLPKGTQVFEGQTLDEQLSNRTTQGFELLAQQLSGQGRHQASAQGAIDALTRQLADVTEQKQALFNQLQGPPNDVLGAVSRLMNQANETVRGGIQKTSRKLIDKIDARQAVAQKGSTEHRLLEGAKLLVSAVNDVDGPAAAEGLVSLANSLNLWDPVTQLIGDLVGRTESNAPVTDLIKHIRTFVQQVRQQFREHLPAKLASAFSRTLSKEEWSHLNTILAKSDLMALKGHLSMDQILDLMTNSKLAAKEIQQLEQAIQDELGSPKGWTQLQTKAQQLARFMMTREPGFHLLRNAEAIARGFQGNQGAAHPASTTLVANVDRLVSLYTLQHVSPQARAAVSLLVQKERPGLTFLAHYLVGQRKDELAKVAASPMAQANHYKGYLPAEPQRGVQLVIRPLKEHDQLIGLGFVKVGDYVPSLQEKMASPRTSERRGYYFSPLGKTPFEQGAMQNAHTTASGVDPHTGFSYGATLAGRIVGPKTVQQISQLNLSGSTGSQLMPIFDESMNVVAYERSADPQMIAKLNHNSHLAENIGVWRGRQAEEQMAQAKNRQLIEGLRQVWVSERANGKADQFVNVLDTKLMETDPVIYDAVQLLTPDTIEMIKDAFGGRQLMIRKDLIADTIGYRAASIGDAWSGVTRWTPEVATAVRSLTTAVLGDDAYKVLVTGERLLQRGVSVVKQNIIVRSLVVPAGNIVANVYQMMSMGISPLVIAKVGPKKVVETYAYLQRRLRQDDIEAELRAAEGDVVKTRNLERELRGIHDANKRMSIWPLIEAGEFSSIHDAGAANKNDLTLFEAKLHDYVSDLAAQLPPVLQTAGRYVLATPDTALFKGLEKALAYGDFIAKAITYEHLMQKKGVSQADALHRISEAYVNYDRLPGRWRGHAESIGALWFWNYKIRITKEAVRILRENPLQALLTSFVPTPAFLGIGSPFEDNLPAQLLNGDLWHSVGPGMGLRNLYVSPWESLMSAID